MRVAEFYLINEKGKQYSLMDLNEYCLLTEPSGFGYSYSSEYQRIGNTFITVLRNLEQGQINGTAKFKNYDNYKSFIDYVESSEQLRFLYKVPLKNGTKVQYYKDVNINNLSKSYIIDEDGYLSETLVFDCLSLWYEENTMIYSVGAQDNEIRWDFEWDSKFADYDTRSLTYINKGHVNAPVLISIDGHIINPSISLYVEGELVQKVDFKVEINDYEKFLYGTKENDFYVRRQKTDGTHESLFNLDVLPDFQTVDEVIRLPKNKNCEIKLTADNEILNAQITILPQYKAV